MAKPLKEIRINFRVSKKELSRIEYLAEKLELNNSDVIREGLRLLYEKEGVNNNE